MIERAGRGASSQSASQPASQPYQARLVAIQHTAQPPDRTFVISGMAEFDRKRKVKGCWLRIRIYCAADSVGNAFVIKHETWREARGARIGLMLQRSSLRSAKLGTITNFKPLNKPVNLATVKFGLDAWISLLNETASAQQSVATAIPAPRA